MSLQSRLQAAEESVQALTTQLAAAEVRGVIAPRDGVRQDNMLSTMPLATLHLLSLV